MRNIKLVISYDGTRYAGWQNQKNAVSIQETIEAAVAKITGKHTNVIASGRTDAGVHAAAQVANFRTSSQIPLDKLQMALNTALSKDIVIYRIEEVGQDFNAQRSAKSKIYRYTIANSNFVDPFIRHFAAKCFFKLDVKKMRKAASCLKGRHDFKSFQATDVKERSSVRTLKNIKIVKSGSLVYIYMEADGFLYNMARNIAGTLVEAARGKIAPEYVKEILKKRNIRFSGPTMPARGLCLMEVKY